VLDFPAQGWHPLDRNVELTIASVDALAGSMDLGPWADWVLNSRDADYLAPAPSPLEDTNSKSRVSSLPISPS
jgi:hypothetical protein